MVKGTNLPHCSPLEALRKYRASESDIPLSAFPMARWPDPVLRIPTKSVSASLWNANELFTLANTLRMTARKEKAVGLAAQQCGIDASLVFLEKTEPSKTNSRRRKGKGVTDDDKDGIFLFNPRFVYRSPETEMLVWDEHCLVMPSKFHATVLRDRRVVVEAETLDGTTRFFDFTDEMARAVQHECQHDEGILIVDHVDLDFDELVTDQMRQIEREQHFERQRRAFARPIVESTNNFQL